MPGGVEGNSVFGVLSFTDLAFSSQCHCFDNKLHFLDKLADGELQEEVA